MTSDNFITPENATQRSRVQAVIDTISLVNNKSSESGGGSEHAVDGKLAVTIRDISDQDPISCLHDQFTIKHVHGGDSLYLYTLFKKSTFKC